MVGTALLDISILESLKILKSVIFKMTRNMPKCVQEFKILMNVVEQLSSNLEKD